MHLLHDLEAGNKEALTVVVEINKGSHNKYEIDKRNGLIALDRVMHTTQNYPCDYGFVPQTLWKDGDPLDVVLLTSYPLFPGVIVKARPVGLMHMVDAGDADDKVIAVPVEDPRWDHVKDIQDINPHILKELSHFYETYKQLQGKEVSVAGFKGRAEAEAAFEEGRAAYIKKQRN